eukprot:CCRYP_002424-RA/>CCRYP_002424-RA protein AED:0.42 eAED:0.48 QI:0/0/0/1/0/0/2/0/69
MNSKGGMDEREFRSYFLNSRMLKMSQWSRQNELGFLAEARTLEFIIYPGVPNTTAVTQETDQSYGPFKT